MCITCRERSLQKNLIRFKFSESRLELYDGNGRSFYMCSECLHTKKGCNSLKKIVTKIQNLQEQLEEIAQIWVIK
ncbi:DUF448 domain-containing protein [Helicobacter didelphidarum]|uniref:DUF448 domain-containing protein n=2 Tax=Helicobacter didelphidarum TaxID=2040648 RepID=A0A3D8IK96_9HELI|nr:DUF448 domain-containing protein [Helicobacter didelphidarum]